MLKNKEPIPFLPASGTNTTQRHDKVSENKTFGSLECSAKTFYDFASNKDEEDEASLTINCPFGEKKCSIRDSLIRYGVYDKLQG